jgi:hypothetical protein
MVGEIVVTKNVVFRIMCALPSAKSDYAIDSLSICCSVYIRKVVEEISFSSVYPNIR